MGEYWGTSRLAASRPASSLPASANSRPALSSQEAHRALESMFTDHLRQVRSSGDAGQSAPPGVVRLSPLGSQYTVRCGRAAWDLVKPRLVSRGGVGDARMVSLGPRPGRDRAPNDGGDRGGNFGRSQTAASGSATSTSDVAPSRSLHVKGFVLPPSWNSAVAHHAIRTLFAHHCEVTNVVLMKDYCFVNTLTVEASRLDFSSRAPPRLFSFLMIWNLTHGSDFSRARVFLPPRCAARARARRAASCATRRTSAGGSK